MPLGATNQEVELQIINGRSIEVDIEIAPLVAALNTAGIPTRACCSGHGTRPGSIVLWDGRILVIVDGLEELKRIDALYCAAS